MSAFMVYDRYMDYKLGSSAALTLIAAACFFMDIACVLIILKQRNFKCFGRAEASGMTEIAIGGANNVNSSRIQYQSQVNEDGNRVVIQPLPERPGNGVGTHAHFQDASVPYRNPAFA